MTAHFETFPFSDGKDFGWRLVDTNGEIIASGEGYVSRANAERGAWNVIQTVFELTGIRTLAGEKPIEITKAAE